MITLIVFTLIIIVFVIIATLLFTAKQNNCKLGAVIQPPREYDCYTGTNGEQICQVRVIRGDRLYNTTVYYPPEEPQSMRLRAPACNYELSNLPDAFDANQYWGFQLTPPMNQGRCQSCWAFTTSTALSDRYRIFSKNILLNNTNITPCQLVAFATEQCLNGQCNQPGCNGAGGLAIALDWLSKNSIYSMACLYDKLLGVHGSFGYDSNQLLIDGREVIIDCTRVCKVGNETNCYSNAPENCPKFGVAYYYRLAVNARAGQYTYGDPNYNQSNPDYASIQQTVKQIQNDLYNYGTVMATFDVYQSFLNQFGALGDPGSTNVYYQFGQNDFTNGGHAVCIVGWGTDRGIPYWLCRNSWSVDWNPVMVGYFKILRGYNFCGIERDVWGCLPKNEMFTNVKNFTSQFGAGFGKCLPSKSTLTL